MKHDRGKRKRRGGRGRGAQDHNPSEGLTVCRPTVAQPGQIVKFCKLAETRRWKSLRNLRDLKVRSA